MDLIVQDFEQIDVQRPEMVAKLLVNREQGMQKALIHNQSGGLAECAKQLIALARLGADSTYNSRPR